MEMKNREIHIQRTVNAAINDAERRLNRGLLTLAEYNEIMSDLQPLILFNTVETIQKKTADFFRLYGVHVEPAGIGYRLTWY